MTCELMFNKAITRKQPDLPYYNELDAPANRRINKVGQDWCAAASGIRL